MEVAKHYTQLIKEAKESEEHGETNTAIELYVMAHKTKACIGTAL